MRTPAALLAGTALGLFLALGAALPATASATTASAKVVAAANPIEGEPWSAPAQPVTCTNTSGQISCTPTDPASVTALHCFAGVLAAGTRSTVCTTYSGHVEALRNDGGKPLLVEYGCSLGDVVCVTFENAGRGMALSATTMMFAVADNMRFDTSSLLWSAAVEEWSFWQWAILVILMGAMVWAIAAAIVSGDREQLVGALVRTFIAIPAVPLTLWVTGHLLNAIDDLTWYILNREGPGSLFATLQGVMWAGGQANYFFAFVIHGLLMIGMLLLMLVFTFRNIVLAALIAVGPIAWMVFPIRGIGPQWVVRYASAVIVLLLTGPLTIGFVTLIINGLSTVKTIWDPQSWPLLFGLVLVAFAPFAIFGLFSFVGAAAADGIGSSAASHAGRITTSGARTAVSIPTRLGASPASTLGSRGSVALPTSTRAGTGGPVKGPGAPSSRPATSRTAGRGSPAAASSPTTTSTPPPGAKPTPQASTPSPQNGAGVPRPAVSPNGRTS
ncbi:hypothetical protein ACFC3F_00430 [Microbacterium sp. NPDC055910]|uniref:hypothetical protein n=1 Tax=Microbacterium sp. NPDC055910 TaxID=3345659 RepID=UPI0035E0E31C